MNDEYPILKLDPDFVAMVREQMKIWDRGLLFVREPSHLAMEIAMSIQDCCPRMAQALEEAEIMEPFAELLYGQVVVLTAELYKNQGISPSEARSEAWKKVVPHSWEMQEAWLAERAVDYAPESDPAIYNLDDVGMCDDDPNGALSTFTEQQIDARLASGIPPTQIREPTKGSLKASPIPSNMTPEQIEAMVERMLEEDFGLPAEIPKTTKLPRSKKQKIAAEETAHLLTPEQMEAMVDQMFAENFPWLVDVPETTKLPRSKKQKIEDEKEAHPLTEEQIEVEARRTAEVGLGTPAELHEMELSNARGDSKEDAMTTAEPDRRQDGTACNGSPTPGYDSGGFLIPGTRVEFTVPRGDFAGTTVAGIVNFPWGSKSANVTPDFNKRKSFFVMEARVLRDSESATMAVAPDGVASCRNDHQSVLPLASGMPVLPTGDESSATLPLGTRVRFVRNGETLEGIVRLAKNGMVSVRLDKPDAEGVPVGMARMQDLEIVKIAAP